MARRAWLALVIVVASFCAGYNLASLRTRDAMDQTRAAIAGWERTTAKLNAASGVIERCSSGLSEQTRALHQTTRTLSDCTDQLELTAASLGRSNDTAERCLDLLRGPGGGDGRAR